MGKFPRMLIVKIQVLVAVGIFEPNKYVNPGGLVVFCGGGVNPNWVRIFEIGWSLVSWMGG